jgi:uncharacterized HAD superfamily protein
MKIGIDLDDVIVDFFPSFINFYNKKYGKNFKFEDIKSFYMWEIGIGKDKQEIIKLVDEFYDSNDFDNMPLISDVKFAFNNFSNDKLFIITSRPVRFKEKTDYFLKKHFPSISFEIIYSNGLQIRGENKAEICRRLGLNYFIEDNFHYVNEFDFNRIKVFLINKPWNKDFVNSNLIRVDNWKEILEKINQLEAENGIHTGN